VKCVVPPGYGPNVDVVVYNGNQPSKAWSVNYSEPIISGVRARGSSHSFVYLSQGLFGL
jgi:hypothetical protein